MAISKERIEYFQKQILLWYRKNGRHHLPWRKNNISTYGVIISELLLQRTKAETVEKIYNSFLLYYPDWDSIVKKGMGTLEEKLRPIGLHKQRSSRILALAIEMVARKGILPKSESEYHAIPMFGQYITNAILLQIFEIRKPLLDVNMARVLERYFGERKLVDIRYDPYLQQLAFTIVNHKKSKEINWGILDFASKICKARTPLCTTCLLSTNCMYFQSVKTPYLCKDM